MTLPSFGMLTTPPIARHVLRRAFGYPDFRPMQARVVSAVLSGHDVLAVLPTGGGKSICFQVPALVGGGLTVVVSPLVALMQDQVTALRNRGIGAAALNSTLDASEQAATIADAARGALRLLYVSPERLPRLCDELKARNARVERLAVDEAHCIVEWGHDFRPMYRGLRAARAALGAPPCVALTGSATPAVREEIGNALGFGRGAVEIVASFDRPNLHFSVVPVVSRDDRLARLAVLIRTTPGAAIVYAPTRGLVEGLARVLVEAGVAAAPYHAGMTTTERSDTLVRFLDDQIRVVVATCAFGMGIDKPGVKLVAHWTMPATPESYYQEAGRAGRDGSAARCIIFHHPSDVVLPRRQLDVTYPPERTLELLWKTPELRPRHPPSVVAAADRLAAELRPDRGAVDWTRVRRRRREAEKRLAAMSSYALTRSCRRRVLMEWFGEKNVRCAGCDRCRATGR
ncbi:MAG: RecQ family ATP-dependent DNA helicase [Gemmatimonadetes bacterium]|nr:RecQ family ATP-dependent DNA helicase [Gemmatimonadota bacterium]